MKYSIVIPTYNHRDDLLKPCLESIFKYTDMTDVELVISANGCIDDTSEYLSDLQQKFDSIGFKDHFPKNFATEKIIRRIIPILKNY